jgi:thiamine biosynthesis lipoprotein
MKKLSFVFVVFILLAIAFTSNNGYCGVTSKGLNWFEESRSIYHGIPTNILFKLSDADTDKADQIAQKAWQEFDRIGMIFNPFNPKSELSKINKTRKHEPLKCSKDIIKVLQISQTLFETSQGGFDPTIWPLKMLWRKAKKNQELPTDAALASALTNVGLENVVIPGSLEASLEFKLASVQFDFGGIVKGYAVDRVKEILKKQGCQAGLVQLGGEVATFGKKDDGPWKIGLQNPMDLSAMWGVVENSDTLKVSSSGNYRQPIMIQGKAYYHIFSPHTGKPVSEKVLGVSTVGLGDDVENALLDGAATAIVVLGAEKGLQLAQMLNIECLVLIEESGVIKEIATPGFAKLYTPLTEAKNK